MALELQWSGGVGEASCEHGHLCAWIEQLPFDKRYAWTVDTPDHTEPSQTSNLAAGVEVDLECAKNAVREAMIRLGATKRGSWRENSENVIQMFPATLTGMPRTTSGKSPQPDDERPVEDDGVDALKRLVAVAQEDTGQARRAANFLLSWWNAGSLGGFDFTDLWSVDEMIADDMFKVIHLLWHTRSYPDRFVPRAEIVPIITRWRE